MQEFFCILWNKKVKHFLKEYILWIPFSSLFESISVFRLEELPFVVIALVMAFTVHEFAHAFVAYKFGDTTAKDQGRLTLNPIQHLDPFGTLLILIVGFGWARPVPVMRSRFKNPRLAGVLVSVAGPLSNFLLAFIAFGIFLFFCRGDGWRRCSTVYHRSSADDRLLERIVVCLQLTAVSSTGWVPDHRGLVTESYQGKIVPV